MEKDQGMSSCIAAAVSVFQSVLTALRFYSKLTAFEAKIEKTQNSKFPKVCSVNSRLKKRRSRNEISANENLRSCLLMSARFLEGKARRPPLIGYDPPFFVLCVCNESLLGKKKGLCGSNQRHANQKVESNTNVPKNKRDSIPSSVI
jgi:hypothetical protein